MAATRPLTKHEMETRILCTLAHPRATFALHPSQFVIQKVEQRIKSIFTLVPIPICIRRHHITLMTSSTANNAARSNMFATSIVAYTPRSHHRAESYSLLQFLHQTVGSMNYTIKKGAEQELELRFGPDINPGLGVVLADCLWLPYTASYTDYFERHLADTNTLTDGVFFTE